MLFRRKESQARPRRSWHGDSVWRLQDRRIIRHVVATYAVLGDAVMRLDTGRRRCARALETWVPKGSEAGARRNHSRG